jgi:hypothetical protein
MQNSMDLPFWHVSGWLHCVWLQRLVSQLDPELLPEPLPELLPEPLPELPELPPLDPPLLEALPEPLLPEPLPLELLLMGQTLLHAEQETVRWLLAIADVQLCASSCDVHACDSAADGSYVPPGHRQAIAPLHPLSTGSSCDGQLSRRHVTQSTPPGEKNGARQVSSDEPPTPPLPAPLESPPERPLSPGPPVQPKAVARTAVRIAGRTSRMGTAVPTPIGARATPRWRDLEDVWRPRENRHPGETMIRAP